MAYGYLAHGINHPYHLSDLSWDTYFVTMSVDTTDETTIDIESKFSQIIWTVLGEGVQKTFLSTPD